jgi:hypothetical protein
MTTAAADPAVIPMPGPSEQRTSATSSSLSEDDNAFLGLLQQVTRCGNDLLPALTQLISNPGDAAALADLTASANIIVPRAVGYLADAEPLVSANPVLRRWWGDVLTHLSNSWALLQTDLASLVTSPAAGRVTIGNDCSTLLNDAGYTSAAITIPPRLNDILSGVAIGDAVNFDQWFKDEIPEVAYRATFLQMLSDQVLLVDGYVDVQAGTITRISSRRLYLPIFSTVLVAALAIGVLVGLRYWHSAPGMPPYAKRLNWPTIVTDTVIVLFGMIIHVALAWYKGFRQTGANVPRSARRLLIMLSARQLSLWVSIIVGAVLTYVFVLSGRLAQPEAIFAVGYSADSFVDLAIPRFSSAVAKLASAVGS